MGKTNQPIRIKLYFILRIGNISTNWKIRMPKNHLIRIEQSILFLRKLQYKLKILFSMYISYNFPNKNYFPISITFKFRNSN